MIINDNDNWGWKIMIIKRKFCFTCLARFIKPSMLEKKQDIHEGEGLVEESLLHRSKVLNYQKQFLIENIKNFNEMSLLRRFIINQLLPKFAPSQIYSYHKFGKVEWKRLLIWYRQFLS